MVSAIASCRALWIALIVGVAAPAWAQRVQFGNPVEVTQLPSTPPPSLPPSTTPPGGWGPAGGAAPPVSPPGSGIPYSAPPASGVPGYPGAPGYTPPAGLQGSVTPGVDWYANPSNVPPAANPYFTSPPPGYQQPGSLFPPQGTPNPNLSSPNAAGNFGGFGTDTPLGDMQRFLKELGLEFTWLAGGNSDDSFGFTTLESHAAFAMPFFANQQPFVITPGFAVHYLSGPTQSGVDLPPRVYDAYIDTGWKPKITEWLSADIGFRIGVYTDFEHTTFDSIRLMGRGLGVIQHSPNLQIVAGVVYLDRLVIKLLPAGGIIWTPNPDVRYEILFPRPKLAQRWINVGTTEWWWYIAGEYGGGSWTIDRDGDLNDRFDYNDLRAIAGLEWKALSGLRGYFEVGFVFDRELVFESGQPENFKPDETVMLRAGLNY